MIEKTSTNCEVCLKFPFLAHNESHEQELQISNNEHNMAVLDKMFTKYDNQAKAIQQESLTNTSQTCAKCKHPICWDGSHWYCKKCNGDDLDHGCEPLYIPNTERKIYLCVGEKLGFVELKIDEDSNGQLGISGKEQVERLLELINEVLEN